MTFRKRTRLQFSTVGPSRTKQAFKDECDINNILKKYQKTNLLNHVNKFEGSYGDFTNVHDYQSSLNAVMDAERAFMDLPASIRKRFNNNPTQIVEFLHDDKNYDEAASLGLLSPEKHQAWLDKKNPPAPKEPVSSKKPASKNDD